MAPFLAAVVQQKEYGKSLWMAMAAGLMLDAIEPSFRFGFFATNFVCATALLYPWQKRFFSDHLTTLPIAAGFFSLFSSLFSLLLWYLTENKPFSWENFSLLMLSSAMMTSCYTFVFFTIPSYIHARRRRRRIDYFLQRRMRKRSY
jgi:rod shape-determining protein MreD